MALLLVVSSVLGAPLPSQGPQPLPFHDLIALAASDPAPPAVEAHLNALLSRPFVSNQEVPVGANPELRDPPGRKTLRIAEWNINRENNQSMLLAFSDWKAFESLAMQNPRLHARDRRRAVEQARALEQADLIVLNEVDKGDKRTGYRDVAGELATRLRMNYVFATEFVELTPLYLGEQKMDQLDLPRQQRASEQYGVDPRRYLGLEGTALLSRFPILSARIVHLPAAYDWYKEEAGAISKVTQADKWTAQKVFDERLKRQVRRGGRVMLMVELELPGPTPDGSRVLTVVCPHLEDYAPPQERRKQMDFVLENIKSISTPTVLAGDLNTMGHNGAPVTGKRLVKDYLLNPGFWARQLVFALVPFPGLSYSVQGINYLKNFHDPTASNIPVVASNGDQPLFADVASFRFDDGSGFDWAGTKRDSFGHRGRTLSVTNQRSWKGFEPSFTFARTYRGLFGVYKLDWILVKNSSGVRPRNGRTLRLLNRAPPERISDHSPIIADLDFAQ